MNKRYPRNCLLFFALCSLFLASCPEPHMPPQDAIPPGMGAFSLVITDAGMRTIKPADGLDHFKAYTLEFMDYDSDAVIETVERTLTDYSEPVYLIPGKYTLSVTAYADTDRTEPAAYGTSGQFEITAGFSVSVTVTLMPSAANGDGTFTWDITLSAADLVTAIMEIQSYSGNTYSETINLLDTNAPNSNTGSLTLSSGYYRLLFTLEKNGDDKQPVIIREILHVYQNLESNFTCEFTDADFNNIRYTVIFDSDDGAFPIDGEPDTYDDDYWHGDKINEDSIPVPAKAFTRVAGLYLGTPPDEYVFDGWYDESDVEWDFTTDVVTGSFTLYAKWTSPLYIAEVDPNNVAVAVTYVNANAALGAYTLLISSGVSAAPQTLSGTNANLTIEGLTGESTISLSTSPSGSLFIINAGASLTLGDKIKLQGTTGGSASLVQVNTGTLVMETGSKITGHTNSGSTDNGGGVYVGANGKFTMNGGTISGNKADNGGGVYVYRGQFEMSGGTIGGSPTEKNTATANGGGVYVDGGTFTMSGSAKVSGNEANNGGGVNIDSMGTFEMSGSAEVLGNTAYQGGGVNVSIGSTFNMNGGAIGGTESGAGNTAHQGGGVNSFGTFTMTDGDVLGNNATLGGGVCTEDGTFTMSGGTISENTAGDGGGVMAYGTFTMTGGTISGNTAGSGGGGVCVNGGDFTMAGSAKVSGNTVTGSTNTVMGGGVYVSGAGGSFTMHDSAEVSGNTVTYTGTTETGSGGGVYVAGGAFNMNDNAKVSGNTVTYSNNPNRPGSGGGVYVGGGTFTMTGGDIGVNGTPNRAYDGAGVFVGGSASTFTMTGGKVSYNEGITAGLGYCGGVYVNDGTFNMSGGEVSFNKNHEGGGVRLWDAGKFNMSGNARVSNNTATKNGGGVLADGSGSIFTMTGGEIKGNNATATATVSGGGKGGGVYVGSTFTMSGGEVSGNTASYPDGSLGGGVYVTGKFTMSGSAKVSDGNTANEGGGVYVASFTTDGGVYVTGTFIMDGGTVSGNTAVNICGGVSVAANTTFIAGGNAKVSGNTDSAYGKSNVFLFDDTYIILGTGNNDASAPTTVTGGMEIWVRVESFSGGNPVIVFVDTGATAAIAGCFRADDDSTQVVRDGVQLKLIPAVEMVHVAGGSFEMGQSGDGNHVTPVHTVTLSGFYIGKYEVTQAQWYAVMGTTIQQQQGLATPPSTDDYGRGGAYPVYYVSWYDALVFCNKLSMMEDLTPAYSIKVDGVNKTNPDEWIAANYGSIPTWSVSAWNEAACNWSANGYRLPTEAQWEYAAKGGQQMSNPPNIYSGSDTADGVAWYNNTSSGKTHEVGKKGANELDIYDMTGNVTEWCWDWYEVFSDDQAQTIDPTGAQSGSYRVSRGGGHTTAITEIYSAYRNARIPQTGINFVGFRVVKPVQ